MSPERMLRGEALLYETGSHAHASGNTGLTEKSKSVVRQLEKRMDQGRHAVSSAVEHVVGDTRQIRYARYVLQRAREDQIAQVAGSLTFTTLLSLVPFVTIALGLFAAFPIFEEFKAAIEDFFLENLLPDQASEVVMSHVTEFSSKAAKLTAAGVIALGITAVLLLQTIDRAFNSIWRVTRPRPLAQRILVYWAAVSLGPILIGGGLMITSYLVSSSLGLLPAARWLTRGVLDVVPVLLTMLAFTLLYAAVPNRDVQWKHAAIGGVAAAVAFEAMKHLFGLYIAHFPTYTLIYGAFAAIPIFLVWIYLSWLVTLTGALIAATWPLMGYERNETRKWPGSSFTDAMRILALLHRCRAKGGALQRQIRAELRGGFTDTEALLDQLHDAGWIGRMQDSAGAVRWALICEPGAVRVAEVFRRFAFDPGMAAKRLDVDDGALADSVTQIGSFIDSGLGHTLAAAFATPSSAATPDHPKAA